MIPCIIIILTRRPRLPEELYVIEPYETLPCELETFTIKGRRASKDDFGSTYEGNRHCDYLNRKSPCKNNHFKSVPYKDNKSVADKYGLDEYEYIKVCEALEDKLYVGECKWCG